MNIETLLKSVNLPSKQKKKILKHVQEFDDPEAVLYDTIGRLQTEDFETVYEDLKNKNLDFKSSNYKKMQELQESLDYIVEHPPEIKEGEIECPKCKTKKTIIQEIQTRSCDEGFTYKLHCYNPTCNYVKIL